MNEDVKESGVVVDTPEEKKRRTEQLAAEAYDDLRQIPEKLFLLSHKDYQSAFDYKVEDGDNSPHMRLLREGIDVQFENGQLIIGGNPASKVDLVDKFTNEGITKLDTIMLRSLFSIIWFNLRDEIDKHTLQFGTAKV